MNFYKAFLQPAYLGLVCILLAPVVAASPAFNGGHAKYQLLLNTFPDDSLFLDAVESPSVDNNGEVRLKFDWQGDKISLLSDYQLITRQGDRVLLADQLPGLVTQANLVSSDDRRLFDLTHVLSRQDDSIAVHRLDRLSLAYTGDRAVARVGRQAISWGNGLIFTPMDIFNPFDPAAVDKEYKSGDDMAYGQYLRQNGDDLQAVWVVRRDQLGEVTRDVDSLALKYHGFAGDTEFDLLLAEHYDDRIVGLGGVLSVGGAILRGDLTLTDTQSKTVASLVTNLSWSWHARGHNFSGMLEYYYNGFGQQDGDYSPEALAANSDLTSRFVRGELFTLGRHYVGTSVLIEMTPLWLLTPSVFVNASDGSLFTQLVSSYDFKQNWRLLAALNIPLGRAGTEYGGIESGVDGKYLSTGPGMFMQLAWYF